MNEQDIYDAALRKWDEAVQAQMTQGECGELIAALCRHYTQGRPSTEEIISELADVEIMCGQMRRIFGEDNVDAEKKRKLERLEGIINGAVPRTATLRPCTTVRIKPVATKWMQERGYWIYGRPIDTVDGIIGQIVHDHTYLVGDDAHYEVRIHGCRDIEGCGVHPQWLEMVNEQSGG